MSIINRTKRIVNNNKALSVNVIGAFLVKGAGMIVSILSLPLYMHYFPNNKILGVWFTVLSVLNWVLSFDVGIGNGLRNHLTIALANNDKKRCKELISSACFAMIIVTCIFALLFYTISHYTDWNNVFSIDKTDLSSFDLTRSVNLVFGGIIASFFFHIIKPIIFALQLSSINNFNHLCVNLLLVFYLFVVQPTGDTSIDLYRISISYALIVNIPYIICSIFVFSGKQLKGCLPNIHYITRSSTKSVLSLGILFFYGQITFMIIAVTNEWFISKFYGTEYCVDYQVYNRLFTLFNSLLLLALSPVWSAITKAMAEKRYDWVIKLHKLLYVLAFGLAAIQLIIVPFIQPIFSIWLGERTIEANYYVAIIFCFYSIVNIWNSTNTTLVSGIGKLKLPLICNTIAVLVKVFGIIFLYKFVGHWSFVVLITAIGLTPYCFLQPIYNKRLLNNLKNNTHEI